jgi:hypothetical protein
MLLRKIIAVYCENHTERGMALFRLIYINTVRTSQETHYVSATKTNRLMLFGETVAVYCENRNGKSDALDSYLGGAGLESW